MKTSRRQFLKAGLLWVPFAPRIALGQGFTFNDPAFVPQKPPAGGGVSTPWMTISGTPPTGNLNGFTLGEKFTVGAANITVTDLGFYIISGYDGSGKVSIWDSGCSLVCTGTVNVTGLPTGLAYVTLGSTATLTASQSYFIGVNNNTGVDIIANVTSSNYSTTSVAAVNNESYFSGDGCNNNLNSPGQVYMGATFKYQ